MLKLILITISLLLLLGVTFAQPVPKPAPPSTTADLNLVLHEADLYKLKYLDLKSRALLADVQRLYESYQKQIADTQAEYQKALDRAYKNAGVTPDKYTLDLEKGVLSKKSTK